MGLTRAIEVSKGRLSFNCKMQPQYLLHHYHIWLNAILDVLRELPLVSFLIFILQFLHVFGNILPKDVVTVHFCTELFGLTIIARETLHAVNINKIN